MARFKPVYNGLLTDGPLSICAFLLTDGSLSICALLYALLVHFFQCFTPSPHFVHVVLFSCYTFLVLYFVHVVFFPCCTFFMLRYFFHFSCVLRTTLFSCCTFFVLYSFRVALFSCCAIIREIFQTRFSDEKIRSDCIFFVCCVKPVIYKFY